MKSWKKSKYLEDNEYSYLGILDAMYDEIIADMNREGFAVGDKYKLKYEELGKNKKTKFDFHFDFLSLHLSFLFLLLFLSLIFANTCEDSGW